MGAVSPHEDDQQVGEGKEGGVAMEEKLRRVFGESAEEVVEREV